MLRTRDKPWRVGGGAWPQLARRAASPPVVKSLLACCSPGGLAWNKVPETLLLGNHKWLAAYESALGCLNWNEIL